MRLASKIDATQTSIVEGLEALGYRVCSLARLGRGAPDLLIKTPNGNWRVVEVKSPGGTLTPDQRRWIARFGAIPIVESLDQALVALAGW